MTEFVAELSGNVARVFRALGLLPPDILNNPVFKQRCDWRADVQSLETDSPKQLYDYAQRVHREALDDYERLCDRADSLFRTTATLVGLTASALLLSPDKNSFWAMACVASLIVAMATLAWTQWPAMASVQMPLQALLESPRDRCEPEFSWATSLDCTTVGVQLVSLWRGQLVRFATLCLVLAMLLFVPALKSAAEQAAAKVAADEIKQRQREETAAKAAAAAQLLTPPTGGYPVQGPKP